MRYLLTAALHICLLVPFSLIPASSISQAKSRDVLVRSSLMTAAQAGERWRSIRTNNLFLVGNASEEDLRQVAVWLEFFHQAFGQLVSTSAIDSSVPTTVVVFKDDNSFTPFKPLYRGRPANVAGYFLPGRDVNYIAFSTERDFSGRDPFSTAFHEYVHLHVMNTIPGIPLWLNEGLAEFYSSLVNGNGDAILGAPPPLYTRLIRSQALLPLTTLFSINQRSPHYNEQDKSGIFYAESWALVHYLMMGGDSQRQQQFKRFLNLTASGESMDKALQDAFGMSVDRVEKEFTAYSRNGDFPSRRLATGAGPSAYMALQRTSVSEGEANFYLGDLLLHLNRDDDAENYFKRAILLDPNFAPTYASLGMLYVRRQRYAEAKQYLQRAVVAPQSYLVHYFYAYILSREGVSPTGSVAPYSSEKATVIREQLREAIKLAPDFSDALYLLAFVDLVTDDQLEEGVTAARQAQKLAPSRLGYPLLLAHLYVRKRDLESARQLLEPLARQNSEPQVRADAQSLLDSIAGKTPPVINIAAIRDIPPPAVAGSPTTLSGASSQGAMRDGQTIDNSGAIPSVEEVIRKYQEALGPKTVTSRVARGSVDVVGLSRGGTVEIYYKAPDKNLTIIRTQPTGMIKRGFNGKTDWSIGRIRLSGIQFYDPAALKGRVLGKSKIGFRDVYVLELQPTLEKLYFDANSYLPVRVDAGRAETYLDDWREVDGIKAPFRISYSAAGWTLTIMLQEVKNDVALDDSLFEQP